MLPGLGLQEMLLIVIVAITVVGPKDLPLLMRKFGRWMSKMRAMASDFQSSFEDLARQAELDELRKEVDALRRDTGRSLNDLRDSARIDDPFVGSSGPGGAGEATDPAQPNPQYSGATEAGTTPLVDAPDVGNPLTELQPTPVSVADAVPVGADAAALPAATGRG